MTSISQTQRDAARRIAHDVPDVDAGLPRWARRNNPIILRQLGAYWRVFLPQAAPLLKMFLLQSAFLLVSIQFEWLFVVLLTFLIPVAVGLPYIFYIYGQALARAINYASTGMAEEYEKDTLRLLRTTPFTTREIVLSKVAAAVWRQADDIEQLLAYAAMVSLPAVLAIYLNGWPPSENNGLLQLMTIINYAACIIRIPLEITMASALGTMLGATVRSRSIAFMATAVVMFFYFLLINTARLVELSWAMQLGVDALLPVVLPVIVTALAVLGTMAYIERD